MDKTTTTNGGDYKTDASVSFEKIKSFLKAKDDTSRFVGLALLKAVLEDENISQNAGVLTQLWVSISPKFLDRLLRAGRNYRFSQSEANNMVDIAVAVLHAFTTLLPLEALGHERLTKRTAPLVNALIHSSPETARLILETLISLTTQSDGAIEFLKLEDLSPLTEVSTVQPLALDVFTFAWTTASILPPEALRVKKSMDDVIPKLLLEFNGTDGVTLLGFLANLLPRLAPEAISNNPEWLSGALLALRKSVFTRPTLAGRDAYTRLASALLQVYPDTAPRMLFGEGSSGSADSKPFSYLFVNLLLIDLKSSFSSLLAKLNEAEYSPISRRLAAAFDILSSFIGFLIRSLDEVSNSNFTLPPDLLLKLRRDISETISLTIEFLRDRWDASFAGASGLHQSARSGTAATSEGTRLTLTWDSIENQVSLDPLILAGIRGIAIWIREDENENLRNEAAGLMDMFLELYKLGNDTSQVRYPILLALEGIMTTEESVPLFLDQEGWQILAEDLLAILKESSGGNYTTLGSERAMRGTQIVRILLAVLDHPSTSFPQEPWMGVVTFTGAINVPRGVQSAAVLEALIASLQLSTALLSKSSGGMTKRYITKQPALRGLAGQLRDASAKLDDRVDASELLLLLDDVTINLENLE